MPVFGCSETQIRYPNILCAARCSFNLSDIRAALGKYDAVFNNTCQRKYFLFGCEGILLKIEAVDPAGAGFDIRVIGSVARPSLNCIRHVRKSHKSNRAYQAVYSLSGK